MVDFKTWLEGLSGPGDGPDSRPINLVQYYTHLANKGAGAFLTGGEKPPTTGQSPTEKYLPGNKRKKKGAVWNGVA